MNTKIIIIYICLATCLFSQELNYLETMKVIHKLEKSEKWEEALPLYNKLYDQLKVGFANYTVKFLFKKGICESKCSKYDAAEKSFLIIKNENRKSHREEEMHMIPMAMYLLADAQARAGKIEDSQKSLKEADEYLKKMSEIEVHKELQDWCVKRKECTEQIIDKSISVGN